MPPTASARSSWRWRTSSPSFFKDKGLDVYAPDVDAFRKHVQEAYLKSDFSKDWPKGMVDQINAL